MIKDGVTEMDEPIQSFLMIGQSNMAGRGEFGEVPAIENPLCYMLRMGRWQKMREPINPDRGIFEGAFRSGVGLSASFADAVANKTNQRVGLIPCADGATRMDLWMPGEVLYDHAVMMTRLAMRSSTFAGILWHQGEADCRDDERVATYKQKFITMMTSLRRDLHAEQLPVMIGELSLLIDPKHGKGNRMETLNRVFHEIAEELPLCRVVSAKDLTLKADGLHFDSASLRVFGRRYFQAYEELIASKE